MYVRGHRSQTPQVSQNRTWKAPSKYFNGPSMHLGLHLPPLQASMKPESAPWQRAAVCNVSLFPCFVFEVLTPPQSLGSQGLFST